jgi:hypothetical protein
MRARTGPRIDLSHQHGLVKNDGLKRDISEMERSYANIKAQTDSLRAELELGVTSDSGTEGSRKRRHL